MECYYVVAKQGRRKKQLLVTALDGSQANQLVKMWLDKQDDEWKLGKIQSLSTGKPAVFDLREGRLVVE